FSSSNSITPGVRRRSYSLSPGGAQEDSPRRQPWEARRRVCTILDSAPEGRKNLTPLRGSDLLPVLMTHGWRRGLSSCAPPGLRPATGHNEGRFLARFLIANAPALCDNRTLAPHGGASRLSWDRRHETPGLVRRRSARLHRDLRPLGPGPRPGAGLARRGP